MIEMWVGDEKIGYGLEQALKNLLPPQSPPC
jgi:hypothetical protein